MKIFAIVRKIKDTFCFNIFPTQRLLEPNPVTPVTNFGHNLTILLDNSLTVWLEDEIKVPKYFRQVSEQLETNMGF